MDCNHNGIDDGPCKHVNPKYCADCCLLCNPRYTAWAKQYLDMIEIFSAENAVKARYKAFRALRSANFHNVQFTDVRVRRIKSK